MVGVVEVGLTFVGHFDFKVFGILINIEVVVAAEEVVDTLVIMRP